MVHGSLYWHVLQVTGSFTIHFDMRRDRIEIHYNADLQDKNVIVMYKGNVVIFSNSTFVLEIDVVKHEDVTFMLHSLTFVLEIDVANHEDVTFMVHSLTFVLEIGVANHEDATLILDNLTFDLKIGVVNHESVVGKVYNCLRMNKRILLLANILG